jgi:hypothetical protein
MGATVIIVTVAVFIAVMGVTLRILVIFILFLLIFDLSRILAIPLVLIFLHLLQSRLIFLLEVTTEHSVNPFSAHAIAGDIFKEVYLKDVCYRLIAHHVPFSHKFSRINYL